MLTVEEPYWFRKNNDYADSTAVQHGIDFNFANHVANVLVDNEDFFIIDWKNKDGSSYYAVRYILDKKRGSFIVYGDLGSSVADWCSLVKPDELASYINDITCYIDKISAGEIFKHCPEEAKRMLVREKAEHKEIMLEAECNPESIQAMEDDFNKMMDMIDEGCSLHDRDFQNLFRKYYRGFEPTDLDKYIDHRVFLWAAGYILACEQLGIIGVIRGEKLSND